MFIVFIKCLSLHQRLHFTVIMSFRDLLLLLFILMHGLQRVRFSVVHQSWVPGFLPFCGASKCVLFKNVH